MDLDTYRTLDASSLAQLVRAGETTPGALVAAARAAHEEVAGTINAVVEWYDDPTLPTTTDGVLAGVPVLRKDYGSAEKGRLVEMGSRLGVGLRAESTAPLIARMQAAGAVIVGRTAVPEFIQHGTTESQLFGPTRNPHDPTTSAGGSSGGSAAAVAAGVAPVATASDCAGSIRIPAAVCGLVGLKPGPGVVPWPGGGWGGIASEFVVTRTVRDSRLLLDLVAEPLPAARSGPLRLACSLDHWAGAEPDPVVIDVVRAAVAALVEAGHTAEPIEPPLDYEQLMSTWHPLFSRWVAHDAVAAAAATGRSVAGNVEPLTAALLETVASLTPAQITEAQLTQSHIRHRLDVAMTGFDVVVTPTLGRPTIPLGVLAGEVDDVDAYLELNDAVFPNQYLFNVVGWPAMSVPAGIGPTGVPLGVQLAGRPGTERTLLRLAAELEAGLLS